MARTLRFEWEVPETVFDDQFPEETFLTQLKADAVCKLFTAGRLSSGYAASAPRVAASRGRSRGGNSRLHTSAARPNSARRASVAAPRMT